MIVEYIRYQLGAGRADAFVSAYRTAARSLDQSTYCQGYDLARCVEDPNVFVLRILWSSAEGHMDGFRNSTEFKAFLPHVKPYIEEIEEMRHYEFTDVKSGTDLRP